MKNSQLTNNGGMTDLHLAARYGRVHEVENLLKNQASPLCKNRMDEFPIHSALFTPLLVDKNFYKRKELIFNAIKKAAPETISAQDASGETIAHKMAAHGYKDLLRSLIHEKPELIFIPDNFLRYPIHFGILNHQTDIVKLLLEVKGVAELADSEGRLALHYAASSNNINIFDACLVYYPTLDIPDPLGETPLLFAAQTGSLPIVVRLIEKGANIHSEDDMGLTIMHHALNSGNIDLVRWIVKNLALDKTMLSTLGITEESIQFLL